MHPKQYLERREAAEFLKVIGLRVSPNTLAKYATIGGGPIMRHFGRRVVYEVDALKEWANAKLTAPCRSTSDTGVAK